MPDEHDLHTPPATPPSDERRGGVDHDGTSGSGDVGVSATDSAHATPGTASSSAPPSPPPVDGGLSLLPPSAETSSSIVEAEEDMSSRVFRTKNVVSSTHQLQVHNVTMRGEVRRGSWRAIPRRRPSEFRSMLRHIRRQNMNDEHNGPQSLQ